MSEEKKTSPRPLIIVGAVAGVLLIVCAIVIAVLAGTGLLAQLRGVGPTAVSEVTAEPPTDQAETEEPTNPPDLTDVPTPSATATSCPLPSPTPLDDEETAAAPDDTTPSPQPTD
ncbi:MAG: hypothetical protein ACFB51_22260, partial [Anaerolineae bacterium]